MTNWMQELIVLVEAEFHSRRIVGTLATVEIDGSPRARMVVVRAFNESDNSLTIATDSRSEKIAQLTHQPLAELVFWMFTERQQFRLRGPVELVHEGADRQSQWQLLTDASRAMYFWPTPGGDRVAGAEFVPAAPPGPVPDTFVLLNLRPTVVEALELNEIPHRRRSWHEVDGWKVRLLNP